MSPEPTMKVARAFHGQNRARRNMKKKTMRWVKAVGRLAIVVAPIVAVVLGGGANWRVGGF